MLECRVAFDRLGLDLIEQVEQAVIAVVIVQVR
jgi:hypothetical protein